MEKREYIDELKDKLYIMKALSITLLIILVSYYLGMFLELFVLICYGLIFLVIWLPFGLYCIFAIWVCPKCKTTLLFMSNHCSKCGFKITK